jgi:hypothetical protein
MPARSSSEDLEHKFRSRIQDLETSRSKSDAMETCYLLIDHPWYRSAQRSIAERFLRKRNPSEEVLQDAAQVGAYS